MTSLKLIDLNTNYLNSYFLLKLSQHRLHNWPFTFQFVLGLYLMIPSLPLQLLQKSSLILYSCSLLSKHSTHSTVSASIFHCHLGLFFVVSFSFPQIEQWFSLISSSRFASACLSKYSFILVVWQSPHKFPWICQVFAGLYLNFRLIPQIEQYSVFLWKNLKIDSGLILW